VSAPRFKLGIGTLAIAGAGLVIAAGIGGLSVLVVNAHRAALLDQLTRGADQLSETIASTTYYDMLENRRPAVHREIVTIGRQKGIEKVRLFNALGTIMFSSDEGEIGRSLDKRAEACYGCHAAGQPLQKLSTRERTRIYRTADGHRVLGMIRPIHNEQSCWTAACHAHARDEAVLGVLDVNLSLAEADRRIAGDQRRFALFAILAIAATSALLWWLSRNLILRPVAELIAGTRRVAEGDLRTAFPATAPHELGDLARAFPQGGEVDLDAVKAALLVKKNAARLKLLGDGEVGVAFKVRCHRASASARAKIEAAGGSVETIGASAGDGTAA